MNKLPVISGLECIRALEKAGFYVKRRKGSHIILRRNEPFAQLVVPEHKKLDRGTLRSIIREADLTVSQFRPIGGRGLFRPLSIPTTFLENPAGLLCLS